jgi:iron complex outermembrane receptor protein
MPAWADTRQSDNEFIDLSLGELLNLEVTSVSKKAQPVSQAAAAVFVITHEDIRRSGVTTIPEALRMVPGLQVAQVDANKWAISVRGFNRRFANKLLVLMDGRSLYTPLFSGVFWDVQDTMLEDIERIEVIRGPGATLWGANAVNGVINIITKSAADTQGGLLSAGAGDQERGFANLRYGDSIGDRGHYRFYTKYFDRDGNQAALTGQETADNWDQARAGFRLDLALDVHDDLTLQGDVYRGESGETVTDPTLIPPYREIINLDQDLSGFNVLARWNHRISAAEHFSLQTYFDRTHREMYVLDEDRDTFDIDFEYRSQRLDGHDLLVGLGYRRTADAIDHSARLQMEPDERDDELFSAFIQDDITLVPARWSLILGSKFEHNDYTGFEYQPNVRLLWTPDAQRSLWASVTRAVRTPGRADRDLRHLSRVVPPGAAENPTPLPLAVYAQGNNANDSEVLMAYEAGFKFQASAELGVDIAAFYNEYDDLRSHTQTGVTCEPAGTLPACLFNPLTTHLSVDALFGDAASASTHGVELAMDWRPDPRWRLQSAYAYLNLNVEVTGAAKVGEFIGGNPMHQFSVRSWYNPRSDVDLDLWLRYVDETSYGAVLIDAYTELDARLAWRPNQHTELAVVGRNLFNDAHAEAYSELNDIPLIEIERSAHLQLRLDF